MLEIERKFLITEFPALSCVLCDGKVEQIYISVEPEVRLRAMSINDKMDYLLTIKGNGDLVRTEVETHVDADFFRQMLESVGKVPITKHLVEYYLSADMVLSCAHVDRGLCTGFMYAEIEFPSLEAAKSFVVPSYLGREVTDDSYYKMKNYWKRTRLS